MNERQYVTYTKKNNFKKVCIILIIIAAVIFAALSAVGIILSSNGEERSAISSAVEENIKLKAEIEEMRETIEALNLKTEELSRELEARPAPIPKNGAEKSEETPKSTETVQTAPRERIKN